MQCVVLKKCTFLVAFVCGLLCLGGAAFAQGLGLDQQPDALVQECAQRQLEAQEAEQLTLKTLPWFLGGAGALYTIMRYVPLPPAGIVPHATTAGWAKFIGAGLSLAVTVSGGMLFIGTGVWWVKKFYDYQVLCAGIKDRVLNFLFQHSKTGARVLMRCLVDSATAQISSGQTEQYFALLPGTCHYTHY